MDPRLVFFFYLLTQRLAFTSLLQIRYLYTFDVSAAQETELKYLRSHQFNGYWRLQGRGKEAPIYKSVYIHG